MRIFDELSVLGLINGKASRDSINAIKWNIRSTSEVPYEGSIASYATDNMGYSGEDLLRTAKMYDAMKLPSSNPRKLFENYNLWALKDEFYYWVAADLEMLEKDLCTTSIILDKKSPTFLPQYNSFSENGKREFDSIARKRLDSINNELSIDYPALLQEGVLSSLDKYV
jgi:hypothetical protein